MSTFRVDRDIAADPTSTALLLAGPAAFDLWPELRRIAAGPRAVEAETVLPLGAGLRATRLSVRVRPPRRTPTAYVTRFEFAGEPGQGAGTITLEYAPSGDGHVLTHANLELDTAAAPGVVRELRKRAERFLANLAALAESRAFAA